LFYARLLKAKSKEEEKEMNNKYDRDSMRAYISKAKVGTLERGLLSIYALQTHGEQSAEKTLDKNNMGFSKKTDKIGTKIALYLLKGNRMTNAFYIKEARKVCREHARQLAEIANGGFLRELRDAQFTIWRI